jgi:hypothetical protein
MHARRLGRRVARLRRTSQGPRLRHTARHSTAAPQAAPTTDSFRAMSASNTHDGPAFSSRQEGEATAAKLPPAARQPLSVAEAMRVLPDELRALMEPQLEGMDEEAKRRFLQKLVQAQELDFRPLSEADVATIKVQLHGAVSHATVHLQLRICVSSQPYWARVHAARAVRWRRLCLDPRRRPAPQKAASTASKQWISTSLGRSCAGQSGCAGRQPVPRRRTTSLSNAGLALPRAAGSA